MRRMTHIALLLAGALLLASCGLPGATECEDRSAPLTLPVLM